MNRKNFWKIIMIVILFTLFGIAYFIFLVEMSKVGKIVYEEPGTVICRAEDEMKVIDAFRNGYTVCLNGKKLDEPLVSIFGCNISMDDEKHILYITKPVRIPRLQDLLYPLHFPRIRIHYNENRE